MRHPLWILNSALLLLLIVCGGFMFFAQVDVPEREEIEPSDDVKTIQKETPKINIQTIYEHDLFGTYVKRMEQPEQTELVAELPPPPQPTRIPIKEKPKPQFSAPLKVTLKGIIIVNNDDTKNRAIIADNTTNKESLYKVEDIIEDGRLIKIFSNKVIFLRANGQQEVLYLRQKDAEIDPVYTTQSSWQEVIELVNASTYMIHTNLFVDRVQNLAQFIDLLDLITVYQKGKSVGCRTGLVGDNSLAQALGFEVGDIILSVNDIPATDTVHRLDIYKSIMAMNTNDTITVQFRRQGQEMKLKFILSDTKQLPHKVEKESKDDKTVVPPAIPEVPTEAITKEQLKTLEDRHKFAPTVKDIRDRERQNMLDRGRAPRTTLTPSITE